MPITRSASVVRRPLQVEVLEDRLAPAGGAQPTALEQVMLERLNDIRQDPAAYGRSIGVDLSGVAASQPLAFDPLIIEAARGHSLDMNNRAYFAHASPEGNRVPQRLANAGYAWTSYAESIAAGYATPESALKGLIIDRGVPNLGHRIHLLAIEAVYKNLNQVGIGIVTNGSGPYTNYFTIDTASKADERAFLTGAVFNDLNNNGKYDVNEGVGNLKMTVHGVGTITTFSSGGYSFQLSPGSYTVTFSGEGLAAPVTKSVTIGTTNQRLNILTNREAQAQQPTQPTTQPQQPQQPTTQPPSRPQQPTPPQPPVPQPPTPTGEAAWVAQIGQRLLQRPLSQAEVSQWAHYLQQGGSRSALVSTFVNSAEYRRLQLARWVEQTGRDILQRPLTASEVNMWVNHLQRSGRQEDVAWSFLVQSGANTAPAATFLAAVARSLLQRNLSAMEMNTWTRYLSTGASRQIAVRIFMASAEYQQKQIARRAARIAQDILGQPLSPADLATWATYLYRGGSEVTFVLHMTSRANLG